MSSLCAADPQGAGFITSVARFVDCKGDALGSTAYQALGQPGSSLTLVLTGFLTIFVALIGYRLLLGESFTLRTATVSAIKIGAVFALATSWPVYRTLVYDLVTDGPAEIISDIAQPAALPGSDGTLLGHLDAADGALSQLSILGAGMPPAALQQDIAPPPFTGFNAFALGGSRILFLITAIAGIAGVRAVAALMLALGPFFMAFLLFDSTRSLFEGWVRVLAGAVLSTVGVTIALGLEMSLMEPWLSTVLARRMGGEALPTIPAELFVVTCVFALLTLALMVASARVARGFRLAPSMSNRLHAQPALAGSAAKLDVIDSRSTERGERSRAAAVADVVASLQRREIAGTLLAGAGRVPVATGIVDARDAGGLNLRTATPTGRSFARRARGRVSARAA
jgi:type IV secretion system protein VirB6